MLSKFGDFRCEEGGDSSTSQVVMYLGGVVLPLLVLLISKLQTQKRMLILMAGVSIASLLVVMTSSSLLMATVGLFFNYGARGVLISGIMSYITEVVSERLRVFSYQVMEVFLSLAVSLTSLVYWMIQPWELAMGLYQLLPFVVAFLFMLKFMENTPL